MGRKGKKNKHSAKDIQRKIDAHKDKGGGKAGLAKRREGHSQLVCKLCRKQIPSVKSMQEHYESKHSKFPWNPSEYTDEKK